MMLLALTTPERLMLIPDARRRGCTTAAATTCGAARARGVNSARCVVRRCAGRGRHGDGDVREAKVRRRLGRRRDGHGDCGDGQGGQGGLCVAIGRVGRVRDDSGGRGAEASHHGGRGERIKINGWGRHGGPLCEICGRAGGERA